MPRTPVTIGPFSGGLNLYDDPTAVGDNELVESINWDAGLDGSLQARPAIGDFGIRVDTKWGLTYVGSAAGWHIFTESRTIFTPLQQETGRTLAWNGSAWRTISDTLLASAVVLFNDVIWISTINAASTAGYWTPGLSGTFTEVSNMPRGASLTEYKGRLFLGGHPTNTRRVYYSKTFAESDIWASAGYITVSGDGGSVKHIVTYFNSILIFREGRIDSFSYSTTVSQGIVSMLVPDVGISSDLIMYENSIYFRSDEKAYQFINNGVQQINRRVPFVTNSGLSDGTGRLSRVGNRIIYHYSGSMYVYNTITRTWSNWYTSRGQALQPFVDHGDGRYYTLDSRFRSLSGLPGDGGAPVLLRENFAWNGNVRTNTNGWNELITAGGAGTVSRVTSSFVHEGAAIGAVARLTCTTAVGTNFYLRFGYDLSTYSPVVAGQQYVVSVLGFQQSSGSKTMNLILDWRNESNVQIGSLETFSLTMAPGTYTRMALVGVTVPAGATFVSIRIGTNSGVAVGDYIQATCVMIEKRSTDPQEWFDGSRPTDANGINEWNGPAGVIGSTSRKYENLLAKLLPLADRFSTFAPLITTPITEDFTCELLTKNYDLQLSPNYKRLFWWGVDAVFSSRLRGWAIPVGGASVPSDYPGPFSMGARRFVKMFKSLRFRQIAFRIIFDTDGTAPVTLFSLQAFVSTKETVTKPIS